MKDAIIGLTQARVAVMANPTNMSESLGVELKRSLTSHCLKEKIEEKKKSRFLWYQEKLNNVTLLNCANIVQQHKESWKVSWTT